MYRSSASSEHNHLVRATVAEMGRQGMTRIWASHLPNVTPPDLIGGYIPDATAYYNARLCVAEVESTDGLKQQHTADQWRAFFNYATRVSGYFIAVVTATDEMTARTLLRQICGDSQNVALWVL